MAKAKQAPHAPYGYDHNGRAHTKASYDAAVNEGVVVWSVPQSPYEAETGDFPGGPNDPRPRDHKGRFNIRTLDDRELLEEIAVSQRKVEDTLESFMDSLKTNPMMKMFAGKFGL